MSVSHTSIAIFHLVSGEVESVSGNYCDKKLIALATDGASNMMGKLQGAVTHLDYYALSGFIQIWFLTHQLGLIIQEVMTSFMNDDLRKPLVKIISFLRLQINSSTVMCSNCLQIENMPVYWKGMF